MSIDWNKRQGNLGKHKHLAEDILTESTGAAVPIGDGSGVALPDPAEAPDGQVPTTVAGAYGLASAVTVLLTGDETTTGHLFRGPDDPADTPEFLAVLEPGDLWVDTTTDSPFDHKERNSTNDGWNSVGGRIFIITGPLDANVDVRRVANATGTGNAAAGNEATSEDGNANVSSQAAAVGTGGAAAGDLANSYGTGSAEYTAGAQANGDGDATADHLAYVGGAGTALAKFGAVGTGGHAARIEARATATGHSLVVIGLPTSDPAVAGALWNDTGTVKVSAG